jgi:histidine ammonia-lyase
MIVGNYILKILEGSKLIDSDKSIIQDPYSIRCIPQIFAAVKSNIDYCEYIVMREMNSYSGNPVIFGDKVYYGGNFHAQLLANAADLLKISASNLAYLSERQINRLLNPNLNRGLPPFLAKEGIGLMICQYLIAYYLNEIRTLATPSSIISVSTSADQEDFVSMSGNAVNDLEKCLDNLKMISSIETLCAYEGAKIRGYELLGKGTKLFYDLIKEKVEEYENINEKIEAIYRNYNFFVEELRKEFGSLFTE